jgi:hypothetical protein
MEFNLDRVRNNVRSATTEDLLDRATVYRAGLEPEALPVILEELQSRGVSPDAVVAHEEGRFGVMYDESGAARQCQHRWCRKPAVTIEWRWHRLFGKVPVFPRKYYLCEDHRSPRGNDRSMT